MMELQVTQLTRPDPAGQTDPGPPTTPPRARAIIASACAPSLLYITAGMYAHVCYARKYI